MGSWRILPIEGSSYEPFDHVYITVMVGAPGDTMDYSVRYMEWGTGSAFMWDYYKVAK